MKMILLTLLLAASLSEATDDFGIGVFGRLSPDRETVVLPNQKVLKDRLSGVDQYFLKKTNLISYFAEREVDPLGVPAAIDGLSNDYFEELHNKGMSLSRVKVVASQILMQRSLIIEGILKDHPKALQELKKRGAYQAIQPKL